jgi:hypothetical protein
LGWRRFFLYILLIGSVYGVLTTSCVKESDVTLQSDTIVIAKTYQPDGLYGKDAIVESIVPDRNFGDSIQFTVLSWTSGGAFNTARAFIEFDLSGIPIQKKISSAKLSFYWISYDNLIDQTGENAFTIYRINEEWDESTVTWNSQPSSTNLDSVSVAKSNSINQDYTDIDVTALVQDMINNPSQNYGFMLKLNDEFPYKLVILASSDYPESSKRPRLEIYY